VTPEVSIQQPETPGANLVSKIGFYFLRAYLFLFFSRILDVTVPQLHLPAVCFACASLLALLSGGALRILFSPIGRVLIGLATWIGVAFCFSTWRGGSLDAVLATLQATALAAVLVALTRTPRDCGALLKTLAFASLAAAFLGLVAGQEVEGRLSVTAGSLADPNEYAMSLLFGVPCWLYIVKSGSLFTKLASVPCLGFIMLIFLRTGSRGGVIGLACMLGVLFLQATVRQKVLLVVASVFFFFIATLVLPHYITTRYTTLWTVDASEATSDEELERMTGADVGSALARRQLLLDALKLTAQHPLFGVGPDQFAYVNWSLKVKQGIHMHDFVTHNTYTQFSSETGIPGFVLYITILVFAFSALNRIRKLASMPSGLPPEVGDVATSMRLALTVLAACSFFLSIAYSPTIPVMLCLCGALALSVNLESYAPVSLNGVQLNNPVAANSTLFQSPLKPAMTRMPPVRGR